MGRPRRWRRWTEEPILQGWFCSEALRGSGLGGGIFHPSVLLPVMAPGGDEGRNVLGDVPGTMLVHSCSFCQGFTSLAPETVSRPRLRTWERRGRGAVSE